jgi:hypothetical protein
MWDSLNKTIDFVEAVPHSCEKVAKHVALSQKTQKTQIPRTLTRGGPAQSQEYLRFGFFEFFCDSTTFLAIFS